MKNLVSEIKNIAKGIGLKKHLDILECQKEWGIIVGEAVARETSILDIRKKTLLISVNSSVWLNELLFLKKGILKKMKASDALKGFSDLRFALRSENPAKEAVRIKNAKKQEAPANEVKIPPAIKENIKSLAANFNDEKISRKLEQIFEQTYKTRQNFIKDERFMKKVCEIMQYLERDPELNFFELNREYGRYSVEEYYFARYNRK